MRTLQRQGGWAMAWAADGSATFGEHRLRDDAIITVQPPATPAIGGVFLRAYRLLRYEPDLEAAIAAGDALLEGQWEHGGFPHEFSPGAEKTGQGTFDDDVTPGATRYLLELYTQTQQERFRTAARRAAEFMLRAQYPNGGFPQAFPLRADHYSRFITLNDDAMMEVIRTLFICHSFFEEPEFLHAARRGLECLLELQGEPPQAGWAQQYTPEGEPAPARRFEPVALSSAETTGVLRLLLEAYRETGEKRWLEAGLPAFAWLESSRLPNGKWARFYAFGSNRPLYCTPAGDLVYEVAAARPGYGWQGNFYQARLKQQFLDGLARPAEEREISLRSEERSLERLKPRADSAIATMDGQGRWLSEMTGSARQFYREKFGEQVAVPPLITAAEFVRHAGSILDYLEKSREPD